MSARPSNGSRPWCLIFDCDGVLVDSEVHYARAELDFLSNHGLCLEHDDYVREFMGRPGAEWRARIVDRVVAGGGTVPSDAAFRDLDARTAATLRERLLPVAGARSALGRVALPMGVASSSAPASLDWKLRACGLRSFFGDDVYSTSRVRRGKPAPDLFLLAARSMGVPPAGCIVVEDSSNGVVAGKRAGMTVIGFTAGAHCSDEHARTLLADGADHVVASYEALLALIERVVR